MVSYNSRYIFTVCIFFGNYFYSMELHQPSYFAHIQVRGCDLCKVQEPAFPLMHIIDHNLCINSVSNDNNYTNIVF